MKTTERKQQRENNREKTTERKQQRENNREKNEKYLYLVLNILIY